MDFQSIGVDYRR